MGPEIAKLRRRPPSLMKPWRTRTGRAKTRPEKRLKSGGTDSRSPWMNLIGVVAHVRYRTLETSSRTEYYVPHSQNTVRSKSLIMRTAGDPAAYGDSVRREVAASIGSSRFTWFARWTKSCRSRSHGGGR